MIVTIVLAAAGWALGWLLAGRARWLPAAQGAPPPVSIVVPARDEAHRLPRLLASLAGTPHELIVVDDESADGTAAIARDAGATVVAAGPLPEGWTGKAWACTQGAGAATGDVLVFLDADVEVAPDGVDALAAQAAATDGLVSAQPCHRIERVDERLSAGPALVTYLGAGTGPPPARRWWRRPMANGAALAIPAGAYERIGGHGAVRGEVAEDVAMARVADEAGVPVHTYLGGARISYRMYPGGARQLWEGWTKNLAAGAMATPPLRLLAVAVWVTAAARLAGGWPVAAAIYAAFAVQVHVVLRRLGRFGVATAALFPLALLAFGVLFVRSTVATVRGRVQWRGRTIPVGPRA